MDHDSLKKLERALRRVFLCLAVIMVASTVLLIKMTSGGLPESEIMQEEMAEETENYDWSAGLADSTYWLPQFCNLYEDLPEITFTDAGEEPHSSAAWKGKTTVLVCFASWCEDCQSQMAQMKRYEKIAENYGDVTFVYLNQADEDRESRETVQNYMGGLEITGELYFDGNGRAYDRLGIRNIPTTLFLNKEGKIAAWSPRQIQTEGEFEALLQNAVNGSSRAVADFVVRGLMDENGGIHTAYQLDGVPIAETEVLSESQGLFLLYAVSAGRRDLFDKTLSYVKDFLWQDGIAAWKAEYGEVWNTNALLDDLRIYRALSQAQELWGGYESELSVCEKGLEKYGLQEQKFVDFYDRKSQKYAQRLTLCYADLGTMEILAQKNEKFQKAFEQAAGILERGQISNEFPLYYGWYNYDRNQYEAEELNAAESMMTLLWLSRQGKLKNNTVRWLKTQMSGDGIKARYTADGKVVKGYEYESTAVYALVALIADEIGDTALRGQALKKMEKLHIMDTSLAYNGAFGMEDGSGIKSFDQLLPALAYLQVERR